jgi:hypothetical protein
MVQIWTDRDDASWIYVEQAAASSLDEPYRQRIYRLTLNEMRTAVSAVYELPDDPLKYAGAWRDPSRFSDLDPDELVLREGCQVVLNRSGKSEWSGSTVGKNCKSTLRGASYATSEVTVSPHGIRSWDRGYDASDAQVWGAEKGAYVFDRQAAG